MALLAGHSLSEQALLSYTSTTITYMQFIKKPCATYQEDDKSAICAEKM
jgi:hypothetical protein